MDLREKSGAKQNYVRKGGWKLEPSQDILQTLGVQQETSQVTSCAGNMDALSSACLTFLVPVRHTAECSNDLNVNCLWVGEIEEEQER